MVETKVEDAEGEGETQHTRREMAKLQTAHMLIHGQLLQARAEEAGAIASKEWLCQQKHPNMKVRNRLQNRQSDKGLYRS